MSSTTETSHAQVGDGDGGSAPAIVQEEELVGLPRDALPEEGTGTKVAYDLMTNELLLDGSARLNLASCITALGAVAASWGSPPAARPPGRSCRSSRLRGSSVRLDPMEDDSRRR